jgi:hypothetical protein
MEAGEVALRMSSGENPGAMALQAFLELAQKEIAAGN